MRELKRRKAGKMEKRKTRKEEEEKEEEIYSDRQKETRRSLVEERYNPL